MAFRAAKPIFQLKDADKQISVGAGKTCLDIGAKYLLSLPASVDLQSLTKFAMQKICGKDTCSAKDASKIRSGPALQVTYKTVKGESHSFKIKPQKFIYKDGDNLALAFGKVSDLIAAGRCPQGSKFAVGRGFFAEKYLLFKSIPKDGGKHTYNVGFIDIVDIDDLTGYGLYKYACWGILAAMLVFFIICCIVTAGRKGSDDDVDMDSFKNMELKDTE